MSGRIGRGIRKTARGAILAHFLGVAKALKCMSEIQSFNRNPGYSACRDKCGKTIDAHTGTPIIWGTVCWMSRVSSTSEDKPERKFFNGISSEVINGE